MSTHSLIHVFSHLGEHFFCYLLECIYFCVNIMVTMTTVALIILIYVVKIMTMIKDRFIKIILELFFSLLKQYSMFNLNFHWCMHYKILMTLKLNNKKKSLVWFQSTTLSKYPNSSFYIQTSSCIQRSVHSFRTQSFTEIYYLKL